MHLLGSWEVTGPETVRLDRLRSAFLQVQDNEMLAVLGGSSRGSHQGQFCPPWLHVGGSGPITGCHDLRGGGGTGIRQGEAGDMAGHPTEHMTAPKQRRTLPQI